MHKGKERERLCHSVHQHELIDSQVSASTVLNPREHRETSAVFSAIEEPQHYLWRKQMLRTLVYCLDYKLEFLLISLSYFHLF